MKIHSNQLIDARPETVWQIFGHEFADIAKWSKLVHSSAAKTDAPLVGHAQIAGRKCETTLGPLDETIQEFNNDTNEVKFLVLGEKFPFFMRSVLSHWRFFDEGGKTRAKTEVTLDMVFPFNVLMDWMVKRNFSKALTVIAGELETHSKTREAA